MQIDITEKKLQKQKYRNKLFKLINKPLMFCKQRKMFVIYAIFTLITFSKEKNFINVHQR